MAAARAAPMRIGNLRQMAKYSRASAGPTRTAASAGPARRDRGAGPGGRREPAGGAGHGATASSSACSWSRADGSPPSPPPTRPSSRGRRAGRQRGRERAGQDGGDGRPVGRAAGDAGADAPARPDRPRALLRGRRQHVPRRRLPHQGRRRPHPVVAARPARARRPIEFTTARCASTRRSSSPPFRDNLESRLILLKRRLDERERAGPHREDRPRPVPSAGRRTAALRVRGRRGLEGEIRRSTACTTWARTASTSLGSTS